jgi:hypothetical protein
MGALLKEIRLLAGYLVVGAISKRYDSERFIRS